VNRPALLSDAPLAAGATGTARHIREKLREWRLRTVGPALGAGGPGARPVATPGARQWLDRARHALSRGDYLMAAYAAGMCQEYGGGARGALIRARAAAGLGLLEEAVTEAQRAVRLAPQEPEGHLTLAGVFDDLGNTAAALRSFQTARRLGPGSATACLGQAVTVARAGDPDRAERLLESVYPTGPDRWLVGDHLGLVLVEAAELIPRVRAGGRYVITSPAEIAAMRAKLTRAAAVAVDPELRRCIDEVGMYVRICARRTWSAGRLAAVPRWKLNQRACEREERDGPG
jgi:Flp pilus assembly protein TadD